MFWILQVDYFLVPAGKQAGQAAASLRAAIPSLPLHDCA